MLDAVTGREGWADGLCQGVRKGYVRNGSIDLFPSGAYRLHNRLMVFRLRDLVRPLLHAQPPVIEEPRERRRSARHGDGGDVTLEWFDFDGQAATAAALLENASEDGFCISTQAAMLEGMSVWLAKPNAPPLKSIIRHVRYEQGEFTAGLQRVRSERRREDRTPTAGTATLRIAGPHGEPLAFAVQIRNVAAEGVQVVAPEALPTKEVARLISPAVECTGTLRYCIPWNDKFLVGLFLIGGVRPGEAESGSQEG